MILKMLEYQTLAAEAQVPPFFKCLGSIGQNNSCIKVFNLNGSLQREYHLDQALNSIALCNDGQSLVGIVLAQEQPIMEFYLQK